MDHSWLWLSESPRHCCVSPALFLFSSCDCEEFSAHLESIILSSEPMLIAGDFNIHVDVVGDPDRVKCLDLLEAMGLLWNAIPAL